MEQIREKVKAILATGKNGTSNNIAAEAERIIRHAQLMDIGDWENEICSMAERRARGEPLAYITGREMFMGIELIACAGALVPRKETEPLGIEAIKLLRTLENETPKVIDMCCGSGNLACAIAHFVPESRIWASDLTPECVDIASRNVEFCGVSGRVEVLQGDLFDGLAESSLKGAVDMIVCGPPFISQHKLAAESAELLEYEPREAFDGGPYGLSIQQRIVKECLPFLREGGYLLFETGLGQERPARMLIERTGAYEDIRLIAGEAGEVRVISARKRPQ